MTEDKSCPHIVDVPGIISMKGCKLTEVKGREGKKPYYTLCPPSCYNSDYTQCPTYQHRGGKKDDKN